jgi:4-amino-4-deoxy-L-arabinose transferase-like glycosyltransferase
MAFFRLGDKDWGDDELIYRDAGLEYVRDLDFHSNLEHPFLVKYILGATQILFDSSEAGVVRLPLATAVLTTGIILFAFAKRVAGYWTGILASALWFCSPVILNYGRNVYLDVFVACFSILALYLGWRWAESRSWRFAAFAGIALGLATASKSVGILFLPAVLLVGLLKIADSRLLLFQSLLIWVVTATTALATYIPLGLRAPSVIQHMFEAQRQHNAVGHSPIPIEVAGIITNFPPWWAHLWWQWEMYDTLPTISLAVAVAIALLRHRPLDLYLLTAILVPFLFLSFAISFKLPFYLFIWQPPLILLLALAAGKLVSWQGIKGVILALVILIPLAYLSVEDVKAISRIEPDRYAKVARYLEDTGHDQDTVLVYSINNNWGDAARARADLPKARVINDPENAQEEEIEVILVDERLRKKVPIPSVDNYLETNRSEFEYSGTLDDIEVYIRKPPDERIRS